MEHATNESFSTHWSSNTTEPASAHQQSSKSGCCLCVCQSPSSLQIVNSQLDASSSTFSTQKILIRTMQRYETEGSQLCKELIQQ